jgi:hypothetical protein
MATVPLFVEEEELGCRAAVRDARDKRRPVFLVRVRGLVANADQLEPFAAAYLLTNAMLMKQATSKILKLVYIVPDVPDDELYPVLNGLRGLVAGEYSGLANIDRWQKAIRDATDAAELPTEDVEAALAFLARAQVVEATPALEYAEVLLGVDLAGRGDTLRSQWTLQERDAFTFEVASGPERMPVFVPEYFGTGGGIRVHINRQRNAVVLDVDVGRESWLSAWIGSSDLIVKQKLYADAEA